jgi:hypothetical protein
MGAKNITPARVHAAPPEMPECAGIGYTNARFARFMNDVTTTNTISTIDLTATSSVFVSADFDANRQQRRHDRTMRAAEIEGVGRAGE